jgi:methionine synthase II (cobalamin-independent)
VVGDRAHSGRNLALLPGLLAEYVKVVQSLVAAGAKYIQVDEPVFALSLGADAGAYQDA